MAGAAADARQSTCDLSCSHRAQALGNRTFEQVIGERYCYEKQPGSGPFYCVSLDNFLGAPGYDRGSQGSPFAILYHQGCPTGLSICTTTSASTALAYRHCAVR